MKRMCLGTVQFGLQYGINNQQGQPAAEEVYRILDTALAEGITYFDTAADYGTAEAMLGDYGLGSRRDVQIISKLALRHNGSADSGKSAMAQIESQIRSSLQRMRLESMHAVLLHRPADSYRDDVIQGLQQCRQQGLIERCGVSVYEVRDALHAVNCGCFDYVQIPYNIWDGRWDRAGFFSAARRAGVKVFARSCFLQGLLLMEIADLPPSLAAAAGHLRRLEDICRRHGYDRKQAALLYAYSHPDIDFVVFGVDNLEQMQWNIRTVKQAGTGFSACRQELEREFADVEEFLVRPDLWNR